MNQSIVEIEEIFMNFKLLDKLSIESASTLQKHTCCLLSVD